MRIHAISALILAIAPSLVSAAPAKDETAARVSYSGKQAPADRTSEWVELASPTPAKYGREYITVEGPYARLRIEAIKGRPIVKAVKVRFTDGKEKVVRVYRTLGGKHSSHDVDLGGARAIEHIVVITDTDSRGTYAVYGAARPATSAVARR